MKHLSMFTGTPQADSYAGYDQVYEDGRIQEAGCIAHVRRKFYDLYVAHKSPVAAEALERIEALYPSASTLTRRKSSSTPTIGSTLQLQGNHFRSA
jgi:transposase